MQTLTINSKAHEVLARAAEKARQEKPVVKKTEVYGVYTVLTHNRTRKYTVTCHSATKEITCNCKASKPCYHIASVAPIHVYIARQLRDQAAAALAAAEAEAAGWPLPVEKSEIPAFDAEAAPVAAPADFTAQVQEIRSICTATAAQLAETERVYGDLIPSFSDYTEVQAAKDKADLFG